MLSRQHWFLKMRREIADRFYDFKIYQRITNYVETVKQTWYQNEQSVAGDNRRSKPRRNRIQRTSAKPDCRSVWDWYRWNTDITGYNSQRQQQSGYIRTHELRKFAKHLTQRHDNFAEVQYGRWWHWQYTPTTGTASNAAAWAKGTLQRGQLSQRHATLWRMDMYPHIPTPSTPAACNTIQSRIVLFSNRWCGQGDIPRDLCCEGSTDQNM